MKWILKAAVQKGISFLPARHKINFLFQKYVTRGVQLSDDYFQDKLTHAIDNLRFFKKHNKSEGFRCLELGSGWYPVVPIALFLGGAEKAITLDISPLMKEKGVRETISKFLEWGKTGKLENLKPFIKKSRWEKLSQLEKTTASFDKILEELRLTIMTADARNSVFENDYFNLIHSNNTFEHIYPEILEDILKEFQRILKPYGVSSHFIDMSDHFAHLDDSITIYNFLKFSAKEWKRIDNSVQPQNRWRMVDYENLYVKLGIKIIEKTLRKGDAEELGKVKIHPEFSEYSTKQLAVSHCHLISSK